MPVVLANRNLPALPLLLRLRLGVISDLLRTRLGVMHRAGWLGVYLPQFTLVDAFGHDSFGGVPARLELRSRGLFFGGGLVGPDFDLLVAGQRRAPFCLLPVGRTDLHEVGFRGDGLGDVRFHLGLIAARRSTLCGIWATCKSFLLAPRPLRANRMNCGQPAWRRYQLGRSD
jgi:hypothetical protein